MHDIQPGCSDAFALTSRTACCLVTADLQSLHHYDGVIVAWKPHQSPFYKENAITSWMTSKKAQHLHLRSSSHSSHLESDISICLYSRLSLLYHLPPSKTHSSQTTQPDTQDRTSTMPRSYQRMLRDLMNLDIDDRPSRRHNPYQSSSSSGTYGSNIYPENSMSSHRRNTYYSSRNDPYSPDPRRYGSARTPRSGQQEWTNVFSSHHRPHRIITRDVYRSYDPFDYDPERRRGSVGQSVRPPPRPRPQGPVSPGWPMGPPIPQISRGSQRSSRRSERDWYRDGYSHSAAVYPDSSSGTDRAHNLKGRNSNRNRDREGYVFREPSGRSGESRRRDTTGGGRVFREVSRANREDRRSGGGGFMGNWFGGRSGWR